MSDMVIVDRALERMSPEWLKCWNIVASWGKEPPWDDRAAGLFSQLMLSRSTGWKTDLESWAKHDFNVHTVKIDVKSSGMKKLVVSRSDTLRKGCDIFLKMEHQIGWIDDAWIETVFIPERSWITWDQADERQADLGPDLLPCFIPSSCNPTSELPEPILSDLIDRGLTKWIPIAR